MKIGIDARLYGPKQGGLGRYVEQLVTNLEQLHPEADFVIFLRKDNWNEYIPSNPRFKKVLADIPWYGWKEQFVLPSILSKEKLDLMHFPHWNVPILYRKKFVVTIHDLILLHYPSRKASTLGPVRYALKNLMFRVVLRNAVKRAKKIITISEFSKKDMVESLRVDPKKIESIYLAPRIFTGSKENIDPRINKPFALYVGVAYPHKNLSLLLSAWSEFNEHHNGSYQLVLAGNKNYFYERLMNDEKKLFENGSVLFAGFVSDEMLSALYQKAALFVYPSLYEGFGLPPLEAMAAGLPVVASNASCLPEILGNSSLFFDPHSTQSLVRALETGFTDSELRAILTKNGLKQAAIYRWEKTAKQTFELYKNSV
jgi:glycosyltransferase involved in cell wall biosynthesis